MSIKKRKLYIYSPIKETIDLFLLTSIIHLKNSYEIIYISNNKHTLGYSTQNSIFPVIESNSNNKNPLTLLKDIFLIYNNRKNSIFVFNGSSTILLSFLLKLISYKTKNIYILHGTLRSKGKVYNLIFIILLFISNLFGVEINSVNNRFLRFCINKKKFKFIGLAGVGIDKKNINTIKKYRKNHNNYQSIITIAFIGRHELSKGIDLYNKICSSNNNPKYNFISIGGFYQSTSHIPQFYQYGPLTREVLFSIYDKIDILIMPSISEGLGMTMVECCIAGIPTIASTTDGSLQFMNSDIGIIINKPDETLYLQAIEKISLNLKYFSNNCILYAEANNNFISKPFLNFK